MRILVMEDDAALGNFLCRGLAVEKHEAELAVDGATGLALALRGSFDLIVMDLALPQIDGMEVLRELRRHCLDASVLVLNGRASVSERVECLDMGADDFLMKPFSFSELRARCRALLRRRERFSNPLLRQGDLELHRMERRVSRAGKSIDLTVKEFALLEYLMLARGRTCSRGELLREVWQMSPDAGTNVVDVYVNYLRKKLAGQRSPETGTGGDSSLDRIIDTVRGEGYSLYCAPALVPDIKGRKPPRSADCSADRGMVFDGAGRSDGTYSGTTMFAQRGLTGARA